MTLLFYSLHSNSIHPLFLFDDFALEYAQSFSGFPSNTPRSVECLPWRSMERGTGTTIEKPRFVATF